MMTLMLAATVLLLSAATSVRAGAGECATPRFPHLGELLGTGTTLMPRDSPCNATAAPECDGGRTPWDVLLAPCGVVVPPADYTYDTSACGKSGACHSWGTQVSSSASLGAAAMRTVKDLPNGDVMISFTEGTERRQTEITLGCAPQLRVMMTGQNQTSKLYQFDFRTPALCRAEACATPRFPDLERIVLNRAPATHVVRRGADCPPLKLPSGQTAVPPWCANGRTAVDFLVSVCTPLQPPRYYEDACGTGAGGPTRYAMACMAYETNKGGLLNRTLSTLISPSDAALTIDTTEKRSVGVLRRTADDTAQTYVELRCLPHSDKAMSYRGYDVATRMFQFVWDSQRFCRP